jgi:putative thioredoxin
MSKNIFDVNEADFEKKVLEESLNKLVVVDFWAPWCGPCKQLTPVLEKIISGSPNKIILAKINIDENQEIAAQLRIQSIPAVFAFKNKQVVNAFQGIIAEKEIIKFLEEAMGEKLTDNFDSFYDEIKELQKNKKFVEVREKLEEFISTNSKEINAICLYAECLIELLEVGAANDFLNSLDEDIIKNEQIIKIIKRIELIQQKKNGPSLEELNLELLKSPENIDIVFKIADIYFAKNDFDNSFTILLKYFPKNKEVIKPKILNFFDILGFNHEAVIFFRKKLSSIMFL